jgi:hypothetical protein
MYEDPAALFLDDEGNPLVSVSGATPEADGGIPLDATQVGAGDVCGRARIWTHTHTHMRRRTKHNR